VSVVANVAINVDSSGAVSKLRQVQQGAQATSQAVDKLNATTAATSDKFKIAANGIKYFTDAAGRARAENGRFLTTAERAAAGIKLQGDAAQQASGKFKGLGNAIASLGAGLALRKAFGDASELESAQARIGLLTKNFQQLSGIQGVAANAAQKFNLSQSESLNALTDLGNRIAPTGASLQDITNVYEGFNTLLALNKVNSQNAASATLQLNQALGSGRLAGEEFNAISEATPQLLDAVAKVMGVTRGELKQLASDGKISSAVLIEALTRIRTEGAADLETAFSGAFGATKRFDAAIQDFSATVGSELLPALTPAINLATQILKLFGQLPGPVKAVAAAILGLAAAFVVLAPAITAAIGLLGGLSIATLAAAGPWIALAAGITAAVVALASYRSESEKIGAKAAAGDPAALAAARNRIASKQQEVSLLAGQRPGPRSSRGGDLANARRELAQLKRDVVIGTTAPATVRPNAMGTPIGATVGGTTATGPTGGKPKAASDEAANAAKQVAEQIRASQVQLTLAQDIFAIEGRLQEAQLAGNDQLVLARNAQKELAQIASQRADIVANKEMPALEKKNVLDKLAIDAATVSGKLGFDLAKIEQDRTKNFEEIIADLDFELKLKQATTEEAREQLRLAYELARLQGQGFTPEQIGAITARKTELARPKTDRERLQGAAAGVKAELDALTDPINMITTAAAGIGDAFSTSFKGVISGSMTAKEALASFFTSVADMFLDMAAQIIAKMIQMAILNTIVGLLPGGSMAGGAGLSSGFNAGTASAIPTDAGGWAQSFATVLPGRAKGGPVSSGQTYMVGERGPELFVPGRSGTIVANDKMGGGSTNVVVNVDASGSSVEGNDQGANQLGRVISAAVQSELIKQQRPGGILAR
jgi:tape measure domain-containing protein